MKLTQHMFVGLLILPAMAFPQCRPGAINHVTVPCIEGWMTHPPRTEVCTLPEMRGWVVRNASFGTENRGGGEITIAPHAIISEDARRSMARRLANEIESSVKANDAARTAELASLLEQLASGKLPVQNAASVTVRITLRSRQPGWPCAPGMTTSDCPHMSVPHVQVEMLCLPEDD